MIRIILFTLVLITCSCSLFNGFKKREFSSGKENAFQILVPKGWNKVTITPDSLGNRDQFYYYTSGAYFYISNTGKPISPNATIDSAMHIALQHATGGIMYKGVMPGLLYWREIQKDSYRFGYRNVSADVESRFDSALNYSAGMKEIK